MKIKLNNGTESKLLPGFNHKVNWTAGIKSEDQSGDSSSTAESHNGFKAALITITFNIRFGDVEAFNDLAEIFYATKDGSPVTYDIIHSELNSFGINQAKFIDDIRAAPDGTQKVYNITLTMKQERSDPEISEERTTPETASTTQPDGIGTVAPDEKSKVDLNVPDAVSGSFEQVLAKLNSLAKDTFFS